MRQRMLQQIVKKGNSKQAASKKRNDLKQTDSAKVDVRIKASTSKALESKGSENSIGLAQHDSTHKKVNNLAVDDLRAEGLMTEDLIEDSLAAGNLALQRLEVNELTAPQVYIGALNCPMMRFVGLISGKWAIPVLYRLSLLNAPIRFGELLRQLQPITQKELTKHLKHFERHGLVTRQVYPEIPPRVEYRITALGLTLQQPLAALADWMERYADQVPNLQQSTQLNDH